MFRLNSNQADGCLAPKSLILRALALSLALVPAAMTTVTVPQVSAAELSAGQRAIGIVPLPQSDLKVDAWVNRGDSTYRIGDEFELFVRTNREAWITVFNVDARGQTTIAFPNQFSTDNKVAANSVIRVPGLDAKFKIKVGGPAGPNLVKVVATTSERSIGEMIDFALSNGFHTYSGGAEKFARQLEIVVNDTPDAAWASSEIKINVVDQTASVTSPSIVIAPAQPPQQPPIVSSAAALLGQGTSGFGLQVLLQSNTYSQGDSLSMSVVAEKKCHLKLVNVDSSGNATVLFPNNVQSDDLIRAGRVRFLPGHDADVRYVVSGASGPQAIVAICTKGDRGLFAALFGSRSTERTAVAVISQDNVAEIAAEIADLPPEAVARTVATYYVRP